MGDFSSTTTVDATSESLFDYLSDVGNLAEYFARMVSATPGDGEQVHTKATMPDGQEVEGDAWFRVGDGAKTIEWGSPGPSSYSGKLTVGDDDASSTVTVQLHTTRVEDGDDEVQNGLDETLANIKRLVEGRRD